MFAPGSDDTATPLAGFSAPQQSAGFSAPQFSAPAPMSGNVDTVDDGSGGGKGNPFVSCCIGVLLVFFLSWATFQNEMHFVKTLETMDMVQEKAKVLDMCSPDRSNDGHLIFSNCDVTAPEIQNLLPAEINQFYPKVEAYQETLSFQIYQWVESTVSKSVCAPNNPSPQHYFPPPQATPPPPPAPVSAPTKLGCYPDAHKIPANLLRPIPPGQDALAYCAGLCSNTPYFVISNGQFSCQSQYFAASPTVDCATPDSYEFYQRNSATFLAAKCPDGYTMTSVTQVSYSKNWVSAPVDSKGFAASDSGNPNDSNGNWVKGTPGPEGNANSVTPEFLKGQSSLTVGASASDIKLSERHGETMDSFVMTSHLAKQMSDSAVSPIAMADTSVEGKTLHSQGNFVMSYHGSPVIGDWKFSLTKQFAPKVTIIVKQISGSKIGEYPPKAYNIFGYTTEPMEELVNEQTTKKEYTEGQKGAATNLAWILRVVCLVGFILAFSCIFAPLSAAADLIRSVDNFTCGCPVGAMIAGAAQEVICLISSCSACFCFTLIFIVCWIVARPWYGIGGVAILSCIVGAGFKFASNKKTSKVALGREAFVSVPGLVHSSGDCLAQPAYVAF